MRLKILTTVAIAALATTACGDNDASETPPVDAAAGDERAIAEDQKDTTAQVEEALSPNDEPEESAAIVESCHSGANAYCRGPVMVKATSAVLMRTRDYGDRGGEFRAKVTYTVENRTDSPIQFNVLHREVTKLTLANGTELIGSDRSARHVSGLTPCNSEMDDCLTLQADDFVVLQPGESPATFNVTYTGRADGTNSASIPRVETADFNVQLVVASPDGGARKISAGFSQVPIFNNLAN